MRICKIENTQTDLEFETIWVWLWDCQAQHIRLSYIGSQYLCPNHSIKVIQEYVGSEEEVKNSDNHYE
jgi:hypothetical protein